MISISQQTIGGEQMFLLLAEPNWKNRVNVSLSYETDIEESRGGIESRRPKRSVPRWNMSFRILCDESDFSEFRQFVGQLGSDRVAVPFWPDLGDGTGELLDPRVRVGWNAEYNNIAINEAGAVPAGDYVAPLLIGRISRPVHKMLTSEIAEITIKFEEESAWTHRADIAGAKPASFTFSPNWVSTPQEGTKDGLDFKPLGDGREFVIEGDDSVTTWMQKASWTFDRSSANDFLGWFKYHRGRLSAFQMDAFCDAGTDTADAPLFFNNVGGRGFMRFSDDSLTLAFIEPDVIDIRTNFEQVLDTTTEENQSEAYLFEIYSDADVTDVARLTDYEAPITANSQTWSPARIELDDFKSSLKLENDFASVEVCLDDLPQIAPIVRHETAVPVHCKIYDADLSSDPAPTTVLIDGVAGKWKLKGNRMTFTIAPFNGVLKRKLPRFYLSRTCNHGLFDAGCARVNTSAMAKANWKVDGLYQSVFSNNKIRIVSLGTIPAHLTSNPINWFEGSWCEVGDDIDKQFRVILDSRYYASGDGWDDAYGATPVIHLTLQRALRTDIASAGDDVVVYAGCNGTFSHCKNKFSNKEAFGGAPFAPAWIEQRPSKIPSGSK